MEGYAWKPYDLNVQSEPFGYGIVLAPSAAHTMYNLQAKVFPKRRNDTGMPNSSPIALNKPIYKIQLNKVTQIHLTPSDKEDDFIQCRMGRFVEIVGIGVMRNTTISQDCIVTIAAMESDGFSDDSWGVVSVVLEDFNRFPIQRGDSLLPAYHASGLSASMLDFMVWVVANMTVPEFVSPTPYSQHVFTVYAGSSLVIPMAAKPSDTSLPFIEIVKFELQSLPNHLFTNTALQKDTTRLADRVMTSNLEWRTEDGDSGNFVIQVVAIDNEGFESLPRSFEIHVSVLPQDLGQKIDANPYFPFFPQAGSVTCHLHATCSVPIFASPGTSGHVIQSIQIVKADTGIPNVIAGPVENVLYRHVHTYRSDVHFTASDVGDKAVCFLATDDHNGTTKKCTTVTLIPPNHCDARPCHVSATCVSKPVSFQCHCPPDRKGTLCETWINPCESSTPHCQHGGRCLHSGELAACDCTGTGFIGTVCETETDDCVPNFCRHGGNCVDGILNSRCECVNGYSDALCDTPPLAGSPCGLKQCDSSSVCVSDTATATATCQCPLGMTGSLCNTQAPAGTSLITPQGSHTVHSVLPTLVPGSEITCAMGSTCTVPVYVPGNDGSPLRVVQGMTSPNLKASVTPLTTDHLTGLPNTLTSSLSVSPKGPGRHSACIDIEDSSSGEAKEEICYTINTPDLPTTDTTSAPQLPAGKRFTDETPPDESVINCLKSIPCHILPRTEVTHPGKTCDSVTTRTEGAYVLGTNNCVTDIVLDPKTTPTDRVCIVVGDAGEKRCYTVNTIDDTNSGSNPCKANPCQHNGVCMVDTSTNGYTCVCHVPYTGDTCDQGDAHSIECDDLPDFPCRLTVYPYFSFFPQTGSVTCQQNATCSVPIFANPGSLNTDIPGARHVIRSILVMDACGMHVIASPVEKVLYRQVHTYRTDVNFTASELGDKNVCFLAIDDNGLSTKKCTNVTVIPPNHCLPNPCHSSATCVSGLVGFQCYCPPHRNGTLCETWMNPCKNPTPYCLHGGNCLSAGEYYACDCHGTGFTGEVCETAMHGAGHHTPEATPEPMIG